MKILVVGCGSIGKRHIRLLGEMGVDVSGFDINPDARQQMAQNGVTVYDNMDDAWDYDPDGVIIATPNHMHVESVRECLLQFEQRGYQTIKAILIEKPVAHTLADALAIEQMMAAHPDISVLIGYNLRYQDGLLRVDDLLTQGAIGSVRHASIQCGSYLPGWRPGSDYRTNYAATTAQGGGVLLDISHEIDYALWLFGTPVDVSCVMQTSGALEIETEDIADIIIRFQSGVQAQIHLDYLNRTYRRQCCIIGDQATLEWRWDPPNTAEVRLGIETTVFDGLPDLTYTAELRHFTECILRQAAPRIPLTDGINVMRVVHAAKTSSATGCRVQVSD